MAQGTELRPFVFTEANPLRAERVPNERSQSVFRACLLTLRVNALSSDFPQYFRSSHRETGRCANAGNLATTPINAHGHNPTNAVSEPIHEAGQSIVGQQNNHVSATSGVERGYPFELSIVLRPGKPNQEIIWGAA